MLSSGVLAYLLAALIWGALIAYATLGGADFGGGIWELFLKGPYRDRQRQLIDRAVAPVWEANNVWLIFVIVATWTAFPVVYSAVSTALFVPVTLALAGIVMRGASFGFSSYFRTVGSRAGVLWCRVFSVASTITPFLLGTIAGALASGKIRIHDGTVVHPDYVSAWTTPFALSSGLFAVLLCALLAATYLTVEAQRSGDPVQVGIFRRRALVAGGAAALVGAVCTFLVRGEDPLLWRGLVGRALPLSLGAVCVGMAIAWALLREHFRLARLLTAVETACIITAWGAAQAPYLVVPDVTIASGASSPAMLGALLISSLVGMVLLIPSLWLLFAVFEGKRYTSSRSPT